MRGERRRVGGAGTREEAGAGCRDKRGGGWGVQAQSLGPEKRRDQARAWLVERVLSGRLGLVEGVLSGRRG